MVNCVHAVCKDCFNTHFTLMIGEKSIKHFNCPVCGEPDMSSETIDMDLYLQLFSGLIQTHLQKENYDLFTQKLNEHAMIKNPSFRWCIKVSTALEYTCSLSYIYSAQLVLSMKLVEIWCSALTKNAVNRCAFSARNL